MSVLVEILRPYLPSKFIIFFSKGHERSLRAKKNIAASFFLKGVSIIISFLLVPMSLDYINPTRYGIWLTLSSVLGWFAFFDIGLGNGLRNKFAEALANSDLESARSYVSTTYAILLIVIAIVYLIVIVLNPILNWTDILNTPVEMESELRKLVIIVFSFFSLQFVLKLVGTILTADQRPAITNSFGPISSIITLIIIYILTKTTSGSLIYLGTTLSACPVIVLALASLFFYTGEYKYCRPLLKYINFKHSGELLGLGLHFFIIQIACLILYATDNMIITQLFGPLEVTPYNIAYKYFGIIIMIFGIITMPFWSAYTEAYAHNDVKWIKSVTNKLVCIFFVLIILTIVMLLSSKIFYLFWIGDRVKIPVMLSIFMGIYAILITWSSIFSFFVNGVGKIRLQLYLAIIGAVANIPLSIFFAKNLGLGSSGVILATCVCISIGCIFLPIQYLKIINNKAVGIWGR
jgi:O-antigen/teichoic acid export membrane protein